MTLVLDRWTGSFVLSRRSNTRFVSGDDGRKVRCLANYREMSDIRYDKYLVEISLLHDNLIKKVKKIEKIIIRGFVKYSL